MEDSLRLSSLVNRGDSGLSHAVGLLEGVKGVAVARFADGEER